MNRGRKPMQGYQTNYYISTSSQRGRKAR